MTQYKPSMYNYYHVLKNGHYLVINTLSSAVATVSQSELKVINSPNDATSNKDLLQACVANGFLVNKEELEHKKVMALRHVNNFNTDHVGIQILPTTECNARCFYCYEENFSKETMDRETIEAVISFLLDYTEAAKHITIAWFGGEPLLQEKIIREISCKLIPQFMDRGQTYDASIITNGSLITKDNIDSLKREYFIRNVQITIDGDPRVHLERKRFIDRSIKYSTILNAIKMLCEHEITTLVRINVDKLNYRNCLKAIDKLAETFEENKYLYVYASPLYSYKNHSSVFQQSELNEAFYGIYMKLLESGLIKTIDALPISYINATCAAKMINNIVIAPSGNIFKCEHLLDDPQEIIGDVFSGLIYNEAFATWSCTEIPLDCKTCKELPICQAGCRAAEKRKFGYGRCSYTSFILDSIFQIAEKILEGTEVNNNEGL